VRAPRARRESRAPMMNCGNTYKVFTKTAVNLNSPSAKISNYAVSHVDN
jgi:hypothetical protein